MVTTTVKKQRQGPGCEERGQRGRRAAIAECRPAGGMPGPDQVRQLAEIEVRANDGSHVRQLQVLRGALNPGPETPAQRQTAAPPANRTGLPDGLKVGLEQLSGTDLSGLRVHYNSAKPAQLNAHAYTQGRDIHVAPGQERHVPHEGWHAVQQMQGRVRPTMELQGTAINDDVGLEREADVMGTRALQLPARGSEVSAGGRAATSGTKGMSTQRVKILNVGSGTNPKAMMPSGYGDFVVNIDSGHMAVAEFLMREPVGLLEKLQAKLKLPFKKDAFERKAKNMGSEKRDGLYKQFIIRALFEKYPGREGFETMLGTLDEQVSGLFHWWRSKIYWLEEEEEFQQGFVEDLSTVVSGWGEFDEIHAISALGFDLFKDKKTIEELVQVLAPGGKLIVTAEKSGMVAKAIKLKKRRPVIDDDGKPVLRSNLPLLEFFDYLPEESEYGQYQTVFEEYYPGMTTAHTTGGEFETNVPFVRLVFELKEDAKDLLEEESVEPGLAALQEDFNRRTVESEFDWYELYH